MRRYNARVLLARAAHQMRRREKCENASAYSNSLSIWRDHLVYREMLSLAIKCAQVTGMSWANAARGVCCDKTLKCERGGCIGRKSA